MAQYSVSQSVTDISYPSLRRRASLSSIELNVLDFSILGRFLRASGSFSLFGRESREGAIISSLSDLDRKAFYVPVF